MKKMILCLLTIGLAFGVNRFSHFGQEQPELKVFTRYKISFDMLEPASYGETSEFDFVSYLYSPLIEFNNEGQLTSGLAKRFYWRGNDLVFELRDGFKSSKGNTITPEDVIWSLKRYNILKPESSKEFFNEVCQGLRIRKIADSCPGLVAEGNNFTIKFSKKKPLYADILTSSDFAIVPKASIDPASLKIIDLMDGTGPYKFSEVNANQSFFRLEARKDHWHWSEKIPQKVLVKTYFNPEGKEASQKIAKNYFEEGKFDFWPAYGGGLLGASVYAEKKGFSTFLSLPLNTYILKFSDRAKRDFTVQERLAIAETLREAFYKDKILFGGKEQPTKTDEFFPPVSDGRLTKDQRSRYEEILKSAGKTTIKRPPLLHVKESYMQDVVRLIKSTNGKLTYESDESYRVPPTQAFQNRFDGFFSTAISPSIESADSIFWLKASKLMPYSDTENSKWIDSFLNEENKEKRISLLKALHFDILTNGMMVPIMSHESGAVIRGPWRLKFSKLFGTSPLWQIEYQP